MGKETGGQRLTPVKAIRDHCLECMGGSKGDVRKCGLTVCRFWTYRMGKNPRRAGIGGRRPLNRGEGRPALPGKKTPTRVASFSKRESGTHHKGKDRT